MIISRRLISSAFLRFSRNPSGIASCGPESLLSKPSMAASGKPRLAILDDYFGIAPEKFARLSAKIEIESFPKTLNARDEHDRRQLISQLQPFTIISTMRERTAFPAEVLRALPNLKLITTSGTKNAAIDLAACRELGVVVVGATGAGASDAPAKPKLSSLDSTMEHAWALILSLTRNIPRDNEVVRDGGWESSPAAGLKGKTLGLLGLGKLGLMTARVAKAFGMDVVAWSSSLTQEQADEKARTSGLLEGAFKVAASKEELLKQADILSIHYVLSDRSRNIIDTKELAMMKRNALLINTSRGPLVNEAALLKCLTEGKIGGAGLDVYDIEPLPLDSPWRTTSWGKNGTSKVILSPHMGYVEEEVMNRWYDEAVENVERYLDGNALKPLIT